MADNPDYVEPFVLDLASNPHPDLIDLAVRARRLAHMAPGEPIVYRYWQGGLDFMAAATGLDAAEIDRWVSSHDDLSSDSIDPRSA